MSGRYPPSNPHRRGAIVELQPVPPRTSLFVAPCRAQEGPVAVGPFAMAPLWPEQLVARVFMLDDQATSEQRAHLRTEGVRGVVIRLHDRGRSAVVAVPRPHAPRWMTLLVLYPVPCLRVLGRARHVPVILGSSIVDDDRTSLVLQRHTFHRPAGTARRKFEREQRYLVRDLAGMARSNVEHPTDNPEALAARARHRRQRTARLVQIDVYLEQLQRGPR